MNRFSTNLFGSLFGIASILRFSSAMPSGGSTRRHAPSLEGHNTNVNSVPDSEGRHRAGI
jgi:hypothetical protein